MRAEILSAGDEVRTGAVVDTNAAFIAEALETIGITVTRHTCVGDDLDDIGQSQYFTGIEQLVELDFILQGYFGLRRK